MTDRPKITLTRRVAGVVSGKGSAALLVLCFALSSIILPVAAHLPRWVEFELVIGAWWVIWTIALVYLLHKGCDITDDMQPRTPRTGGCSWGDTIGDGCAFAPIEAGECGGIVVGLLAIVLLIAGLWLAIEVLIPGLAFLLYWLVRGMAARAVNDRKDCKENLLRSAGWGVLWATLYTAPLALAAWAIHAILPRLLR
jgi:hypothetical protein